MTMHRMSSLPIARFCAAAPELGRGSASRAALMGRAFHARCAGDGAQYAELAAMLTEDEVAALEQRLPPADAFPGGAVLEYRHAEVEVTLHLHADGESMPGPGDDVITGHADMIWTVGDRTYVGDIKSSERSSPDGPGSLQMHAYGLAAAMRAGTTIYRTGHWYADVGRWDWAPEVDILGPDGARHLAAVVAAARNTSGEFAPGDHCRGCWSRMKCPEHLVPIRDPEAALAPFAAPGGITRDNAAALVDLVARAREVLERCKAQLEAFAEQDGGIPDGAGKVWRRVTAAPKPYLDAAALERDHPDLCSRYYRTSSKPRNMGFRWCREGGGADK